MKLIKKSGTKDLYKFNSFIDQNGFMICELRKDILVTQFQAQDISMYIKMKNKILDAFLNKVNIICRNLKLRLFNVTFHLEEQFNPKSRIKSGYFIGH